MNRRAGAMGAGADIICYTGLELKLWKPKCRRRISRAWD